MSDETLIQVNDTIQIGTDRYRFTQKTQQFLNRAYASTYPKDTSVIIIDEPHESSEGHFNLFKGLESFFASNPELVGQTIFLSEGTAAGKAISVQPLIEEDPHPTDETIRQVLLSHMITGYMAYEWKHQQGIRVIGTEHVGLYTLSRRWASMCRENPNAIFQRRKYKDGTEHDIPLWLAWSFAISARNKYIAQTLIGQTRICKNPMLFVATDHVKKGLDPFVREWVQIIKRNIIDAQYMGVFGQSTFIPGVMGEFGEELHRGVPKDCENFDIDHYLEQERIGYTFLTSKGSDKVTPKDEENYTRLFHIQRESKYE